MEYVIRFCSEGTPQMPWTSVGTKFGEILAELTNGKITTEVYPNSTLAGGALAVDLLRTGNIQMYVDSPSIFSNLYRPIEIFEVPYLFETFDEANRAFDSAASGELLDEFRSATNLRVLGGLNHGFRHVVSAKPIRSIADLKGLKIRVGPTPLSVLYWKSLGTNPIPIEFSELYTSLATGIVDALEEPLFALEMAHFDEVTEYINLTGHQPLFAMWVMNEAFYRSLPIEYQKNIDEAMRRAVVWGRKEVKKAEDEHLIRLAKNGMQVIEPDTDELGRASRDFLQSGLIEVDQRLLKRLRSVH